MEKGYFFQQKPIISWHFDFLGMDYVLAFPVHVFCPACVQYMASSGLSTPPALGAKTLEK